MLNTFIILSAAYPINISCTPRNVHHDCGDDLICDSDSMTCQYCTSHDQCQRHFYCRAQEKEQVNRCEYEPLIHAWDTRLIIGMCCIFVAGVFVSGAGIGGGSLFVPIMMLVVNFPYNYAMPTSKALIWGGSIAVTLFNLKKRHPYYDRPLINYNIAAIIEPTSWLGTVIGVIFNDILPDWILYSAQFLLLSFTAWSTFKKGIKDLKKSKGQDQIESLLTQYDRDGVPYTGPAYSKGLLWTLFIAWGIFLVISVLRGGDGADSVIGIRFCSPWYWALTFGPFPFYAILTWQMIKVADRYPVVGPRAKMSCKTLTQLILSGFAAGIAAGFLGIGGGVIKGPMMLALDIEAEEMAATSTFMILLTSSATSIQYIAMGTMPIAEFFIFAGFGIVSFIIGVIFLRWIVKVTGKRSIFLFLLASVIAVSAVLIAIVAVTVIIDHVKFNDPWGFIPFCRK